MLKKEKKKALPTFINDVPIGIREEDKFQFYHIAEMLKAAIDTASKAMHICLAGQWGSGKSTVLSLLENMYNNENEKVKFITVSVWKFAENPTSLQRKILRDLESEFGVNVKDGFERTKSQADNLTLGGFFAAMSLLVAKKISFWIITSLFVLLLTIGSYFSAPMVKELISSFSIGTYIILLIGLIAKSQISIGKTITYNDIPLSFSDQFEKRFENLLKTQSEKYNKVIIIFDDMDRLPHNQLYASLNTVRTFLRMKSINNCTFIVPCDENILREELREAIVDYDGEKHDSYEDNQVSEFLNKTFDLMIRLPLVEQRNMKEYAIGLLLAQPNDWSLNHQRSLNNVLSVLIHSEITTPRQVIKILNAFTADWELAKRRDLENKTVFLTKNPIDLAIFTVLKTDYPQFFDALKRDSSLLRNAKNVEDVLERYKKNENFPRLFISKVLKFIPFDIRPYLYFHNTELNPITGRLTLMEARQSLINGDEATFKLNFEKLDLDEKPIILDSIIEEFNNEIEMGNILEILFTDSKYVTHVTESRRHDWEYGLEQNIDIIINFPLENVLKVFDLLVTSNIVWEKFGGKILNNRRGYDNDVIFEAWRKHPQLIERLNIHEKLVNLISDNARQIGYLVDNDPYYVEEKLLQLEKDHSLFKDFKWITILLDTVDSVFHNIQTEHEDVEEQNIDYSSLQLPFNIVDWLTHIDDGTKSRINVAEAKRFISYINILDDIIFEGFDTYIFEPLINNNDVESITELLYYYGERDGIRLLSEHVLLQLNILLKDYVDDNQLNTMLLKTIQEVWNNNPEDALYLGSQLVSIPSVIGWIIGKYEFGTGVHDKEIKQSFMFVDNLVTAEQLHSIILEKNIVESNDSMQLDLLSIFEGSNSLLKKYSEIHPDLFNFEKFDSLRFEASSDIFKSKFKLPLILKRYHNDHMLDIEREMVALINEQSSYLYSGNYPYRNQWNNTLNELFGIYLDECSAVSSQLDLIEKFNFISDNPGVFQFLSPINRDKFITISASHIPSGNQQFNTYIYNNSSYSHKEHIRAFAERFQFYKLEEQNTILTKIRSHEADVYSLFYQELKKQLQLQQVIEIIDSLHSLTFTDSEKDEIVKLMLDHAMSEALNNWFNEHLESFFDKPNIIIRQALKYAIQNFSIPINSLETVRDSLSYNDERTEIGLMILLNQIDKQLAEQMKEKIKAIYFKSEFTDLAQQVMSKFGWKKPRLKV
ncbi:P-loop NTPase fold protein [Bacillus pinisoli]|uniref:P-loop NTPase fold protein n=1 Tax=Bacillus pinisoli TaxID=2901866 RepID=UPI001FF4FD82|nr:P-loop NTPase fold protein [Bacillus pinisoli]